MLSLAILLAWVSSVLSLQLESASAAWTTRRSALVRIVSAPAVLVFPRLPQSQLHLLQDPSAFCWSDDDGQCARLQQLASLKSHLARAKMIVFDKDGTLGDCSSSLKRWAHYMTDRLEAALVDHGSAHVEQHVRAFHSAIGWDARRGDVVPSAPLAAGTWSEQVVATAALLRTFGLSPHLAKQWNDELGNVHSQDEPVIANLKDMLLQCRELGLRVAVCTSDDRTPTDLALGHWGITNLVEYSICGNEVTEPKPSAMPLMQICNTALIHPSECIMVGDTTADTGMARNAQTLLCIGVLTGSGTPSQLFDTGADIVLPHVGHVPSLLEAMGRTRLLQPLEMVDDGFVIDAMGAHRIIKI